VGKREGNEGEGKKGVRADERAKQYPGFIRVPVGSWEVLYYSVP
jgi:hypothetical protein